MSHWEALGQSDEWFTPKYIFDALDVTFDLDVAHPKDMETHVPCRDRLSVHGLEVGWWGFVWMNPPFGGRNGIQPWLEKFVEYGNGIALTADRTSAPWFQEAMPRADLLLFMSPKVKFERPDGTVGKWPSTGTVLWAMGAHACDVLKRAKLGCLAQPVLGEVAA